MKDQKTLMVETLQHDADELEKDEELLKQAQEALKDVPAPAEKRIPLLLKIYGILCLVTGFAGAVIYTLFTVASFYNFFTGDASEPVSFVLLIIYAALSLIGAVMFVIMGFRLVRNKRKAVARIALTLTIVVVVTMLVEMMISGFDMSILSHLVQLAILIAIMTYLDPAQVQERMLQQRLKQMDSAQAREERNKAWARERKEYIPLNFFNVFWIFVVCCVIGILIETVYVFVCSGHYMNRTGMLFGPFSPIYGFGALLMTISLNRFYKKPAVIIFLISAVIGGAFEYLTSWFMELAFGVVAWDYSGTWLSIGGRTNGMYMIMWGLLGLAWIKLMLPLLLKGINLIPWNWRYAITSICCVLMIVDGVMTLSALGCWSERQAGETSVTAYEQFYADNFPDDWMANHFQTMSFAPEKSANVN